MNQSVNDSSCKTPFSRSAQKKTILEEATCEMTAITTMMMVHIDVDDGVSNS
jgi:hypothetical protein